MSRFRRHLDEHQPMQGEFTTPLVRVSTFQESSTPGEPLLDIVAVHPLPSGVRIAIVDPAIAYSPLDAAPGAFSAVGVLTAHGPTEAAFSAANAAAHRHGVGRSQGGVYYVGGVCDWDVHSGAVVAMRAGDSEIWAKTGDRWVSLFPGDMLTESGLAAWANHPSPVLQRQAHLNAHDERLGHLDLWNTAPLGMFCTPKVESVTVEDVSMVAVMSDGFLARDDAFDDIASWIEGLHNRPDDWPHAQPHGDIAVAVAKPVR